MEYIGGGGSLEDEKRRREEERRWNDGMIVRSRAELHSAG
jgi:hypothetical protein